jgi:hypothetical protein
MTEAANDSLSVVRIRDSGFEPDFPDPACRIPDPGPLSVIVYSWTVDHAVGLLFAMEELAW